MFQDLRQSCVYKWFDRNATRDRVAKKRPAEAIFRRNSGLARRVAGRHPLKQGLKLLESGIVKVPGPGRRAASTKTRIETEWVRRTPAMLPRRRAASTKTRIETRLCIHLYESLDRVAGRHPLKQGLKLMSRRITTETLECRRAASTKTRIETLNSVRHATVLFTSQGGIH